MKIGDPAFIRFKQSLIDQGADYETDDDYLEAFNNLVSYVELLDEIDQEQKNRNISESEHKD
jgi:hypothetical protein